MRTLSRGDSGPEVQAVTEALASLNLLDKPAAKYGAHVERAVRAFQLEAGLIVDGLAGRRTIQSLHQHAGRQVQRLIVHHSATPRETTVAAIRAFHMQERGWSDIAYHTCIRLPEGRALVQVAPGRGYDGDGFLAGLEVGAGVLGEANFWSLQVCLIGDFDVEPVPSPMWDVLVFWLAGQCVALGLGPTDIVGHREVSGQSGTVCPGSHVDLDLLRADVSALLFARREEVA